MLPFRFVFFCVLGFVMACEPKSRFGDIGTQVSNPSFVLGYDHNFYVLNSNVNKEYASGSVLRLDKEGNILGATPVEDGGTSFVRNSELFAIAFCPEEEDSYIKFYLPNNHELPRSEAINRIDLASLLMNKDAQTIPVYEKEQRPRVKEMSLIKESTDQFTLTMEIGGSFKAGGIVFVRLNSQGQVLDHYFLEDTVARINREEFSSIFQIKTEKSLSLGQNRHLVFSTAKNLKPSEFHQYNYESNPSQIDTKSSFSFYHLKNIPGLRAATWSPSLNKLIVLKSEYNKQTVVKGLAEELSNVQFLFDGTNLSENNANLNSNVINNTIPPEFVEKVLYINTWNDSLIWASYNESSKRREDVTVHSINIRNPSIISTIGFTHEGSLAIGQWDHLILGASYSKNTLELFSLTDDNKFVKIWDK